MQWWQVDKVSPLKLFDENRTLSGFNLRRLMFQQGGTEFVNKAVQNVFTLFQEQKIKPLLDSTWALEDVCFFFNILIMCLVNLHFSGC